MKNRAYKEMNEGVERLMEELRQALLPLPGEESDEEEIAYGRRKAIAQTLVQTLKAAQAIMGTSGTAHPRDRPELIAEAFVQKLPAIGHLLQTDVEAVVRNDPAASSVAEVVCCYPATTAMLHHRTAHALHQLGAGLLPRVISERAHSLTGIDIHPAARIGASFGIDHGTGIVIGATTVIGINVMIYQGVTLGAKKLLHDTAGRPIDCPRHPIVEDDVTIYANTTILGPVRIGHHSVVGGNLWVAADVEPYSHLRQPRPIRHTGFIDGDGI